jgi:hypothetical protein
MSWASRLRHPIRLADGRTLKTLSDARDMILALPEKDQRDQKWQRLADLLIVAANSGNANLIAVLTGNIEEALRRPPFSAVRLADDDVKKPPAESIRRKAKPAAKHRRRLH